MKKSQENSNSIAETLEKFKDVTKFNKELTKLEKLVKAQEETIDKLLKEIDSKNKMIESFKNGDHKNVPSAVVERIEVSPEEVVVLTQLKRLQEKALIQTLTLEEIKIYDMLVKNKRLINGQNTENASYKVLSDKTDSKELLAIAQTNVQEED